VNSKSLSFSKISVVEGESEHSDTKKFPQLFLLSETGRSALESGDIYG